MGSMVKGRKTQQRGGKKQSLLQRKFVRSHLVDLEEDGSDGGDGGHR